MSDQIKTQIIECLRALADSCDGAHKQDNLGFNAFDSDFGKDMADLGERMSEGQVTASHRMLKKYKRQLKETHGLILPPLEITASQKKEKVVKVELHSRGWYRLSFNYSPELIAIAKSIEGRKPHKQNGKFYWLIPLSSGQMIAKAFEGKARVDFTPQALGHLEKVNSVTSPAPVLCSIKVNREKLAIAFAGLEKDVFYRVLGMIRNIQGARFDPTYKVWRVGHLAAHDLKANLEQLGLWDQFEIDPEFYTLLKKLEAREQRNAELSKINRKSSSNFEVPAIPALKDYQRAGVEAIVKALGRILLGDEMGLGKTVQAIAYMSLNPGIKTLVVCPAYLKTTWVDEIYKWYPMETTVLSGSKPSKPDPAQVYIINYDILKFWYPVLSKMGFELIIADECHMVKNRNAQRSEAFYKLAKKTDKVIGLTGTPIDNKPYDIFGFLNMLDSQEWSSEFDFKQTYMEARHNGYGWQYGRARNTEQFFEKAQPYMIRRLKSEVLTELPSQTLTRVKVGFENLKAYNAEVYETKDDIAIAALAKLRAITGRQKIKSGIKFIKNTIDQGEKIVVGTIHRETAQAIKEALGDKAVLVLGGMSSKKRDEAKELFMSDDSVMVYVGTIQASMMGLTLTAASKMLVIEYPWKAAELNQFFARIHRIGQDNAVNIYTLEIEESIDSYMIDLISTKQTDADMMIDGELVNGDISQEALISAVHAKIYADID